MANLHAHGIIFLNMLVSLHQFSSCAPAIIVHNVIEFGANPNGIVDTSQAFLKSWKAACETDGPTIIEVPEGRYLLKPITIKGNKCISPSITIQMNGTLVAPKDYKILGKVENWLTFKAVSGVSIIGDGVLDAKGPAWWACKASKGKCSEGATTMRFVKSNNIYINGITSLNSQKFHIGINGCQNVHIEGVSVIASASSPNTDGIHVESSMQVTIINSTMQTGDDCISIGPGVKDLHIENISCGPGHGISIGSLGWVKEEQGVQNITVKSVVLTNTTNGLRIKSWARPSEGFVQGVLYQDVIMRNVKYPIIVDQNYCPDDNDCPNQASGIRISNVTYNRIYGTSATKVAVTFNCSSMFPCTGIRLENINITSVKREREALSICTNIKGNAIEMVHPNSCFLSDPPFV